MGGGGLGGSAGGGVQVGQFGVVGRGAGASLLDSQARCGPTCQGGWDNSPYPPTPYVVSLRTGPPSWAWGRSPDGPQIQRRPRSYPPGPPKNA